VVGENRKLHVAVQRQGGVWEALQQELQSVSAELRKEHPGRRCLKLQVVTLWQGMMAAHGSHLMHLGKKMLGCIMA